MTACGAKRSLTCNSRDPEFESDGDCKVPAFAMASVVIVWISVQLGPRPNVTAGCRPRVALCGTRPERELQRCQSSPMPTMLPALF